MRYFIGIKIPEFISEQIEEITENIVGCDWVHFDDLHLTLQFLGELTVSQMNKVRDELESIQFTQFDLQLNGIEIFGSEDHPRGLWTRPVAIAELVDLHSLCRKSSLNANVQLQNQGFKPHVSIARFQQHIELSEIGSFLQINSLFKSDIFRVETFELFESKPNAYGAKYRIIQSYEVF